jgi:2-phospho-L-lactate guanylyltransferase
MNDVVIPIKKLSQAKGRLRLDLSPTERAELVLAMLHDLLSTLQTCDLGDVWLVASDDAVLEQGARFGARLIREDVANGYNQAVQTGLNAVEPLRSVVVLPADLPLVTKDDLTRLSMPCKTPTIRVVPDRQKRGTNALFLSSPDLIAPLFGANSFFNHQVAATRVGIVSKTLPLASLALDVDIGADLIDLVNSGHSGASVHYLDSIAFGQMPMTEPKGGVA